SDTAVVVSAQSDSEQDGSETATVSSLVSSPRVQMLVYIFILYECNCGWNLPHEVATQQQEQPESVQDSEPFGQQKGAEDESNQQLCPPGQQKGAEDESNQQLCPPGQQKSMLQQDRSDYSLANVKRDVFENRIGGGGEVAEIAAIELVELSPSPINMARDVRARHRSARHRTRSGRKFGSMDGANSVVSSLSSEFSALIVEKGDSEVEVEESFQAWKLRVP
ncbi:2728_t:CDS:2, partial [Acaulospora colombiana]